MLGLLSTVRQAHRHAISLLTYLPDGTLVSGDARGVLAHWDGWGCRWRERIARRAITAGVPVTESRLFLGSFDGSILELDLESHQVQRRARMRRGIASLDGDQVRGGVVFTTFNGCFGVLRGGSVVVEDRWREARGAAFARAEDPGGTVLLWGMGSIVQRRVLASLEELDYLNLSSLLIHDVCPLPGGLVMTVDYDHRVATWLSAGWVRLHEIDSGVHGRTRILGVVDERVWLSHDNGVSVIALRTATEPRTIELPGALVSCLNGDATALAVGYRDGTVQIWTLDQRGISKN